MRIGLAMVMLWFGISQLSHAANWYAFLPSWTDALPVSRAAFIHLNGFFEIIAGTLLALGLFTRIVSIIIAAHLAAIAVSLGASATAIRDYGLTIAFVSIFLYGPSEFSLDMYFEKSAN